MKKILFIVLLVFTMNCERVYFSAISGLVLRCENDEVICYKSTDSRAGLSCKFKEVE